MKASELREKSVNELLDMLKDLRKEQWQLKLQGRSGQIARYHRHGQLRRDTARIFTVLGQKEQAPGDE